MGTEAYFEQRVGVPMAGGEPGENEAAISRESSDRK
jgi:hypothetical protein